MVNKNPFGAYEATKFAKAFAADNGVNVKEQRDRQVRPYVQGRDTIVMGSPTFYNDAEYLEDLHTELSKVLPSMRFFYDVEYEEGSKEELVRNILQAQRTEYELQGEYAGRDSILRERYKRRVDEAGGLDKVMSKLDKTSAALMYLDNELRSNWQTPSCVECPKELQKEVDRLRPILEKEWLTLNNKKSLETLIKKVTDEDYQEQPDNHDGDGTEGGDAGGDSAADEGRPSETRDSKDSSPAEQEGSGEEAGGAGGDSEEEGGGGEGAERSQSESGTGSDGESGGTAGDAEGAESNEGGDHAAESQSSESGGSEDSRSETSGIGFSESYQSLKDAGLIKSTLNHKERQEDSGVPYEMATEVSNSDLTMRRQGYDAYEYDEIKNMLEGFTLSKKVKKYLISTSQVGYEYGLKRGRLNNKSVHRIVSSDGGDARIFKKRQNPRLQVDTAMTILGDSSGSMGGDKYTTSAACQIAFSEALQAIQVPHNMLQFTTRSRTLYHTHLKGFEERYVSRDEMIMRYSDNRTAYGSNADGEAVIWAIQQLLQRKERHKVLVVLSDGYPAYLGDCERFLEDVVREAEALPNFYIMGLGIQSDAVEDYYTNHKVVRKLEDLEPVIMQLLKERLMQ